VSDERLESGLFASLRRMLATLLALVQTRLELISVEIEEQIDYAAAVLLWTILAVFFGSLTVLLLALTVVILFWDGHRLLAAGAVTGAFALVALTAVLMVRSLLARRPRFLASTVDELRRDAAAVDAGSR